MIGQIDIFIKQLLAASQDSRPVNMTDYFKRLGMDIVGLLAFGYPLNMQTDPTNRFVIRGLNTGGYQNNCAMQFPLLKKLGFDHLCLIAGFGQRMKYLRLLKHMISTRLSQEKHASNDLYSFVVDHLDNAADGITTSELWSEALFFFPAGGDTTATALSALFFYLSRHPAVYEKLASEIRGTFRSAAEIRSGPQLAGCLYLRACIDEALRMSPPVSGTLWREPIPADHRQRNGQPFVVDGHVVPPGTQVGVSIYALHHNAAYFAEPFAFRPERWLPASNPDPAALARMRAAFAPFSLGARACAGKSLAYLQASVVAAKTLWYFDFEAAPLGEEVGAGVGGRGGRGNTDEFQLYDIFAATHDGPNLVFRTRGEVWREIGGEAVGGL